MNDKPKTGMIILALLLVILASLLTFVFHEPIEQALTGKVTARAHITEAPQENCSVVLDEGINTVSFFCETSRDVNDSLANNGDVFDFKAVYIFNEQDSNNPWRIYNKDLPEYISQGFSQIRRNVGYIILMNEQRTYSHDGILVLNNQFSLREGWNLIGYPLNQNRTVEDALNSIEGIYERVETFDYESKEWITYEAGVGGDLQNLEPMRSYWIKVNEDVTLTIQ